MYENQKLKKKKKKERGIREDGFYAVQRVGHEEEELIKGKDPLGELFTYTIGMWQRRTHRVTDSLSHSEQWIGEGFNFKGFV